MLSSCSCFSPSSVWKRLCTTVSDPSIAVSHPNTVDFAEWRSPLAALIWSSDPFCLWVMSFMRAAGCCIMRSSCSLCLSVFSSKTSFDLSILRRSASFCSLLLLLVYLLHKNMQQTTSRPCLSHASPCIRIPSRVFPTPGDNCTALARFVR